VNEYASNIDFSQALRVNPLRVQSDTHHRQVIGAAHAAASWVRARRATWSPSPLGPPPDLPAEMAVAPARPHLSDIISFDLAAASAQAPVPDWISAFPDEKNFTAGGDVPKPVKAAPRPSAAARAMVRLRSIRTPSGRSVALAGAAALVLTAGVAGKPYWSKGLAKAKAAVRAIDSIVARSPGAAAARRVEVPLKPTGRLELTSEPAGARVLLDGKLRGVTPLAIDDLAPGTHAFELQSGEGSIRRSVLIKAGETAEVAESIFGGWVKVFAPFEVTISEGTRVFRLEEGNQIMVPAGRHQLKVTNRALGYESIHRVEVKPGETASISVPPPASSMMVTASAPAEVWVDGALAGPTPVFDLPVTLGTHEVVLRRAGEEDRRFVVTVTMKPFTLAVDFSKP
jgi:PEGA domain